MKNISIWMLLGIISLFLCGCGQPEQLVSTDPVCLPEVSSDTVMEAANAVLSDMQFSIEKYDFDACYIRTRPLSGAQFFQVFRGDNASSYTAAEANIYSLRRVVEIEITPFANRTCIQCRAMVQQLSIPEKPLVGTTRMAGQYTTGGARNQTLALDPQQAEQIEWLDRGPDRALENKIIEKIKQRIEKGK
ncbi:MAG: hypothetical protein ACYTER_06660 [Planctomycetota bacterium]|jgi:hypothetical protein